MIHLLLALFIILCIVGVILYGISQVPSIPPIFKTALYVVVAIVLLVWLLNAVNGGAVRIS